jgi:hypothetical protein
MRSHIEPVESFIQNIGAYDPRDNAAAFVANWLAALKR